MDLKERKRLILLSLTIKGVAFYVTFFSALLVIALADNMKANQIFGCVVMLMTAAYSLTEWISWNDFKRILFLSRIERREADRETI